MKSSDKIPGVKALRNRSVIFVIFAAILIISGVIFGIKPISEIIKRNNFTKTEGWIAGFDKEVSSANGSDFKYIPIIDFELDGQIYEFKEEAQKASPEIGAKIDVFYDSKNPTNAVSGNFNFVKLILPVAFLLGGIFSLILSVVIFSKYRKLKKIKKQQDFEAPTVLQPQIQYAQPHHFAAHQTQSQPQNYGVQNQNPQQNIQTQSPFVQKFTPQNNQNHNDWEGK